MSTASLVIQTSFIGDMVLTTPLIAALAARGPVDVLGTPVSLPLLGNNPHVRRVVEFDKHGMHAGVRGMVVMVAQLRRCGPYGSAYLAQGSLRSAALAWTARVPERIGFTTSAGRRFYTRAIPYDETAHHAVRLLRLAGGDGSASRPRLYPGAAERATVDALLLEHTYEGGMLVALAPGSVWATKRWPYYPDLAHALSSRARVVVIGSAADAPLATAIRERVPRTIDACGRLSLLESAELIGRCSALVSNDSAPVHLASAMNTPTIAVFGPTVPEFGFGPLADRSVTAGHEALACRPCHRHGPRRCPLGHWRCMRELSVGAITDVIVQLVPTR